MGESFLKAYYSIYSLADKHIGLIRVADATRVRYNQIDDVYSIERCTKQEADDLEFHGRIEKCGTLRDCYDQKEGKYSNSLCGSKHESCSSFKRNRGGCIRSQHCESRGTY